MSVKQEIEEIRESVKAHDRQIDGLIRAFTAEHETVKALSSTVNTLAGTVVAHDRQLEGLIKQWQAYLRRLPPQ